MPQFGTYPNASSVASGDTVLCLQGGAVKQATIGVIQTTVADASRWTDIPNTRFTSAPVSATQIQMSNVTDLAIGLPLRLTTSAGTKYLIITNVQPSYIDVKGPTLGTDSITAMNVGKPEMVSDMNLFVAGSYSTSATVQLLEDRMETFYRWRASTAHVVEACFVNNVADSTTAPKINVRIAGTRLLTDDSGNGVQVSGAGVWNDSVFIDLANSSVTRNNAIEIEVTAAGGDGDAKDLTVTMTFIVD